MKRLFAHLDELMGKNRGRQINIIVSCQAGRRQKVTGFPCDGGNSGISRAGKSWRAGQGARCVLGARACAHVGAWLCPRTAAVAGGVPPVPSVPPVPAASFVVPRPRGASEPAGGAAPGRAGLGRACRGQRAKHEPVCRSARDRVKRGAAEEGVALLFFFCPHGSQGGCWPQTWCPRGLLSAPPGTPAEAGAWRC